MNYPDISCLPKWEFCSITSRLYAARCCWPHYGPHWCAH